MKTEIIYDENGTYKVVKNGNKVLVEPITPEEAAMIRSMQGKF